jgi:hypothetical protein
MDVAGVPSDPRDVLSARPVFTLFALSLAAGGLPGVRLGPAATPPAVYSQAVANICSGALLFEGRHTGGTRAGALAVARDIRASTRRRLERVRAIPAPHGREQVVRRWIALERRLADAFATSWVRIFEVVDAADTPRERAREVPVLERLVHAPDGLRAAAARLEQRLEVPDCTGGELQPAPG